MAADQTGVAIRTPRPQPTETAVRRPPHCHYFARKAPQRRVRIGDFPRFGRCVVLFACGRTDYDLTVLVGREQERLRLDRLIARARGGESAALLLHGEPGIGKTRLLEHASAGAADFWVLRARPLEAESELVFAGLSELL